MNRRNLLPVARQAAYHRRRAVRRWVKINAAYAVLVTAVAAAYMISRSADGPAGPLAERVATPGELARLNARLVALRQQSAGLNVQWQSVTEVTDRPDWGCLLAALAGALSDDAVLTGVDTAADAPVEIKTVDAKAEPRAAEVVPARIVLGGIARSQAGVSRFVLRVEAMKLFTKVQLLQTAPQPLRGIEGVGFRVVCTLPGGGK